MPKKQRTTTEPETPQPHSPAIPTPTTANTDESSAVLLQRATSTELSLRPEDIIALQQPLGNRTIDRLLMQRRLHSPATHPAQKADDRTTHRTIQRKLLKPTKAFKKYPKLMSALQQLMTAIQEDEGLSRLLNFVEEEKYATDLEFDVRPKGAPGETQMWIGGENVSDENTLNKYMKSKGLQSIQQDRIKIVIVITPSVLHSGKEDTERDELQVLAHEYAIHAIKFVDYIINLRAVAEQGDMKETEKFINTQGRTGDMSALKHHHELVFGLNKAYVTLVKILNKNMLSENDEKGAKAFNESYEKDIKTNAIDLYVHQMASELDVDIDVDELMKKDIQTLTKDIDIETILQKYERSKSQIDNLMDKLQDITETEYTPLIRNVRRAPVRQTSTWDCCFITTACIRAQGLPDDCAALTTLRRFRDEYMRLLDDGELLIETYYQHSPAIVRAIDQRPDAQTIYRHLYDTIIACVTAIHAKHLTEALHTYITMVLTLRATYTPNLTIAHEDRITAALARIG